MDGNFSNDVLIIHTERGILGTIIEPAWYITHMTNQKTSVSGYQDRSTPRVHPIVHAVSKANFLNREDPVLLKINYVTLLRDNDEKESLCQPFNLMSDSLSVDLTSSRFVGKRDQ